MRVFYLFIILNLYSPHALSPVYENYWVIWNVGQGQWITQVTNDYCRHFDFGGEIQYFKNIQAPFLDRCQKKANLLYLSHPDLDHYAFITLIATRVKSVCWMAQPENFQPGLKISQCPLISSPETGLKNQTLLMACHSRDKNSCSTVFKREKFLMPGDSPKSQEKHWIPRLENSSQVKVLILGHHGSRTSTKAELLNKLPHLNMAIASARKKKYGHPHWQTVDVLSRFHIPLIRTESWGNLIFL